MGPWGIAALVLIGAVTTEKGRETLREVTKSIVKAGYIATKKGSSALGDLKEEISDVVAEVKAEQGDVGQDVKVTRRKKTAEVENAS